MDDGALMPKLVLSHLCSFKTKLNPESESCIYSRTKIFECNSEKRNRKHFSPVIEKPRLEKENGPVKGKHK